ncbi:MAG: hypothetical protein WCO60_11635 [Verrucomicrobiota bacterium]
MKIVSILLAVFLPVIVKAAPLPELNPVLGEKGAVLFEENFNAPDAKPIQTISSATSMIVDGALWVSKLADAKHIGVSYLYSLGKDAPPPLTDFIMQADFRWDNGENFSFEFTKPGKVEHGVAPEFFVGFWKSNNPKRAGGSWSLTDNAPKNLVGKLEAPFEDGVWYRVMIEVRNDEVAVQLSNGQSLRGKCSLASNPKRSPSISYNGNGETGFSFDNFKIWAVK